MWNKGIADIGIVSGDILDERHYNVNNLLNMPLEHVICGCSNETSMTSVIVKSQQGLCSYC